MNHAQQIQARDKVAVVLYSLPGCVQCTAMARKLTLESIPFTKIDVSQDLAAYDFMKALGYLQAPVTYMSTIDGDDHFGGYNPDKINAHVHRADAA